jgi:glycosyltransferase involved in cell wall biosynthesis
MTVIAAKLPVNQGDKVLEFDNPELGQRFADVLAADEPDVVHFHCVQGLSASILQVCAERGIPHVVTVHDAWWLCQRQFMVRDDGQYCFQNRIDVAACERCIPSARHLGERLAMLTHVLAKADRVLFPSVFHRALHLANGIPAERSVVMRNGVLAPTISRPPHSPGPLRFGYVGGYDPVKGINVIRAAFEGLERDNYVLMLVDNTLNLGFSSMDVGGWKLRGEVKVVPAYRQETMDGFFAGLDVLLCPSQWKESFGLTAREALLRDVWVIATDAGGLAEDIVDGENGTVIPMDGDPRKLRAAVTALLDAPEWFEGYVNPYKDRIVTYEQQAESLFGVLQDVARQEATKFSSQ